MNPMLQMLNRPTNNNLNELMTMLKSNNPNAMFNQLLQSNPQFQQFVQMNRNKPVEQIAREHGIDLNILKQLMR